MKVDQLITFRQNLTSGFPVSSLQIKAIKDASNYQSVETLL